MGRAHHQVCYRNRVPQHIRKVVPSCNFTCNTNVFSSRHWHYWSHGLTCGALTRTNGRSFSDLNATAFLARPG